MTFSLHPEAAAEFLEAVDYYEGCGPGLGEDFAIQIHTALQNILGHPAAWPLVEEDVRRCLVHRFPYGILYSVEPDRIFVLAVMHLHRDPHYWQHRRT